jgi:uncharacterized membrane protein (DUF106 family)
MLLSPITDIKNFAVGGLTGGFNRAGRWGGWAFGFRGESYNKEGQFNQFHIGGMLAASIVVGLLTLNPVVGAALYTVSVIGAAVVGGITGFISGAFNELTEGWAARREWRDQLAQERDQSKLQQLAQKREKLGTKMGDVKEKMSGVQERMQKRAEKGGHVNKLLQERAGAPTHARGK